MLRKPPLVRGGGPHAQRVVGGEAPAVPAQRIVNSMTGGVKKKSAKLMTLPFQCKASFCIIPLS